MSCLVRCITLAALRRLALLVDIFLFGFLAKAATSGDFNLRGRRWQSHYYTLFFLRHRHSHYSRHPRLLVRHRHQER